MNGPRPASGDSFLVFYLHNTSFLFPYVGSSAFQLLLHSRLSSPLEPLRHWNNEKLITEWQQLPCQPRWHWPSSPLHHPSTAAEPETTPLLQIETTDYSERLRLPMFNFFHNPRDLRLSIYAYWCFHIDRSTDPEEPCVGSIWRIRIKATNGTWVFSDNIMLNCWSVVVKLFMLIYVRASLV